ncbi:MAG: NAD(P)H-binding protein [Acetobacteraceae bacterium]
MNFVVTGAAGHVSRPLTELLLQKGHHVTVVGRNPDNLAALKALGAAIAVGDMADVAFLTETFQGADGVYLMLPPMWNSADQKKESLALAEGFKTAIEAASVRNVVFLSSYGAHRLTDAGPISGMGLAENVLNTLDGVNVLHLRAGYFYSNLLLSLGLVKTKGHNGQHVRHPRRHVHRR